MNRRLFFRSAGTAAAAAFVVPLTAEATGSKNAAQDQVVPKDLQDRVDKLSVLFMMFARCILREANEFNVDSVTLEDGNLAVTIERAKTTKADEG